MLETQQNTTLEIPKDYFLESDRLILKPTFKFNNIEIARIANNKLLADYMGTTFPYNYSEKDAENFKEFAEKKWQEQSQFHFGIQTKEGAFIGAIGMEIDKDGKCTNFGYWLGEEFWGKGYASEAVNTALAFSFNKLGLRKIEARVHDNNPTSQRVLEKAGFKKEGLSRQSYKRRDGQIFDVILYGMTKEDYENRN